MSDIFEEVGAGDKKNAVSEKTVDITGGTAIEGQAIGVLTSTLTGEIEVRDPLTGKFLPGYRGGAAVHGRGRGRKALVLDLIESTVDPAVVVATIFGLITNTSSWRAREAGVKLYLSYMIGMPVQRSVTATTKLESILDRLGSMDDNEFDQVEAAMRGE